MCKWARCTACIIMLIIKYVLLYWWWDFFCGHADSVRQIPKWNFWKFLVSAEGQVLRVWKPEEPIEEIRKEATALVREIILKKRHELWERFSMLRVLRGTDPQPNAGTKQRTLHMELKSVCVNMFKFVMKSQGLRCYQTTSAKHKYSKCHIFNAVSVSSRLLINAQPLWSEISV